MNRTVMALAALLVVVAARPVSAQALGIYNQPANPYAQPPVSPYLNLLQRGGNPAVNYYGLVLPQIDTQRYIQQQEILALQKPATTGQTNTPGLVIATGHPTRFLTYNQYFLTQGAPGAIGGGGLGGGFGGGGLGGGGGFGGGGFGGGLGGLGIGGQAIGGPQNATVGPTVPVTPGFPR
jgi:uncharacterized membrane protein YgcG